MLSIYYHKIYLNRLFENIPLQDTFLEYILPQDIFERYILLQDIF